MSRSDSGPKHNPRPPARRSLGDARLSMLATPRPLTTRAEFAADIRREWSNALEATIAVGRRLNEAKAALPHGEYEAMVATDLPFSTSTARKLREIAAFVDEGQVPLDRLPEAMSTLYAIATLPDDTRQQALDAGTIHPAVTRAEVEALKVPAVTPAPARPPRESRFAAALSLPWSTDPDDPGAITVELDGVRRYLLVMVAPDPAAADVVRHVVELHNAGLRG
ncbi:DUF3102 domain-containing protein [Azospirillum sp. HJ39]|uniref:DUF3102 domain-containing protein n=1 Tax=Azospirillum sp. HJ39 TaxID=3159496 RepID=UPI0035578099